MTELYLIAIGGTLAGVIFIASIIRKHRKRETVYEVPLPWQYEDYAPRKTTITADFITKRDET